MRAKLLTDSIVLFSGDCLEALRMMPDQSVNCCVTSPPYYRAIDYKVRGQIGWESTPDMYVEKLAEVFREVLRVLRDDGCAWVNLGDCFARPGTKGYKVKEQIGIPWMTALALRKVGWMLRQECIWHKSNANPSPIKDRLTASHEQVFLLTKNPRYYFDSDAMKEPAVSAGRKQYKARRAKNEDSGIRTRVGFNERCAASDAYQFRNKRSVWTVSTKRFRGAHFATFPPDLIEPCILAGCPAGGVVIDPFMGSGTTGMVSRWHGRKFVGIELNPDYLAMARERIMSERKMKN